MTPHPGGRLFGRHPAGQPDPHPDSLVDHVLEGDPHAIASQLVGRFRERHRRHPSGVFTAPGRVNLIGEHTDYNGGLCLPVALPHATYAAAAPRADEILTVMSVQQNDGFSAPLGQLGPGQVRGWAAYVAGVVWAMRGTGLRVPGMDIVVDSRVPVGAGLSSSAALECATALAACDAAGIEPDDEMRHRLVAICMRAEREVAGAPTGGMDQTISLLGRAAHALLIDCRDWTTQQVPWDPRECGVELLVVDTRTHHSLSDGQYAGRRKECETAASALGVETLREVDDVGALVALADERIRRRAAHVVSEIRRVTAAVDAIRSGDMPGLGRLFNASHASLRDDFEVSCVELDLAVDTARGAGALGARMTGGGFGGSAVALVPSQHLPRVERAIADAFWTRRWAEPGFLNATPSGGATRLPARYPPESRAETHHDLHGTRVD